MTRLQRFCLGLYPLRWRARYGGELEELVSASHPGRRGTWNLFAEAIRLQMTSQTLGKMVVFWTVLGLVAGFFASFLAKPLYISEATMILDRAAPGDNPNEQFLAWKTEIESRSFLATLFYNDKFNLRAADVMRKPMLERIEGLRRDLMIEALPTKSNSSVPFRIAFIDTDRQAAQQVVRAVIQEFFNYDRQRSLHPRQASDLPGLVAAIEQLQARIDALEKGSGRKSYESLPWQSPRPAALAVLDPASFPEYPIFPNRRSFALTGAGIGLSCGLILFLLRRVRNTRATRVTA